MRQRVEIIKCLRRDPQVLVFDEPTSVLTPEESDFLFAALRRVVEEEGKAVALVSHKLPEVLASTDEITIMRDGQRRRTTRPTADSDAASLARAMVGREVSLRSERSAFGLVEHHASQRRPRGRRRTVGAADVAHRRRHDAQPGRPDVARRVLDRGCER